ncbi:unnamed protein product [Phytophthora lilii]|uniref:Unnamed protein product n=1 Tax=Phytophthora lilii TaxID=2077276 RepID=A0A9W6YIR6_9STRA|nr:unnamed protein product [Phytophthora lilii]
MTKKKEKREEFTMNYAGSGRNKKETRKWLQLWRNENEPLSSVAAKLGVHSLPHDVAIKSENWGAFVKYRKMVNLAESGRNYAFFGTGYQTEKKTKEHLLKWLLRASL